MNKITKSGWALALGLAAGCGSSSSPTPATYDVAQVDASLLQSFERLSVLQIVNVNKLVLNLPAEATSCYSLPCPGSEWVKPYQDERARQAPRLAKLAEIAESSLYDTSLKPRDKSQAEAAVAALAALEVVEISGLVQATPKNNPQCYNLPCESDVAEADAQTGMNVARAFTIADVARRNGL